jgi:shikimate kinase
MQKKSHEIRLEKAKKKEEERLAIGKMKTENPQEYLSSLYKKRKDIYEKLQEISDHKEEFAKRSSRGFQKRIQMMAEIGSLDNGKKKTNWA